MGRRESPRKERERSKSPVKRRERERSKSPVRRRERERERSKRAVSESPSPRTKRLKKAKAERQVVVGKDSDTNNKRDTRLGRDRDYNKRETRRGRSDRDELTSPRDDEQQNGDDDSVAKMKAAEETLEAKDKQKPSFELSGNLAAETNRFRGVTLLFNEPPEARMSDKRWRLYVFKGGEPLNEPLYVHRQSCYLFGRERRVADIPTDHPSCSKQHAVLQYRQVEKENPDGSMSKRVSPYLMDLGSTNGTFINDDRIEAQRYYELVEKDNIKFGNSSREYVLLHENSAA